MTDSQVAAVAGSVSPTLVRDDAARCLSIAHGDVTMEFHYIWLRNNCRCVPHCRHPKTLEPIVDPAAIDPDIRPAACSLTLFTSPAAADDEYRLHVKWSDGHSSEYESGFLCSHAYAVRHASALPCLPPSSPSFPNHRYATSLPSDYLASLLIYGCLIVRDGPASSESTLPIVTSRLSPSLIETHFGLVEDLRPVNTSNANNDQLGYTNAAVDLHTDQPFLASPPSMQILHCIQPAADGGGLSTVSDGIAAAKHLRSSQPLHFRLLSTVPVRFHRQQAAFSASFTGPIIRCDSEGEPLQVRSSYFTLAPFRLNSVEMPEFYAAYRHFSTLLHSAEFSLSTALNSGDFLLYDNHRMLHARTAFTGTERWLRGVYVDREQVLLNLRDRVKAGDTWD